MILHVYVNAYISHLLKIFILYFLEIPNTNSFYFIFAKAQEYAVDKIQHPFSMILKNSQVGIKGNKSQHNKSHL